MAIVQSLTNHLNFNNNKTATMLTLCSLQIAEPAQENARRRNTLHALHNIAWNARVEQPLAAPKRRPPAKHNRIAAQLLNRVAEERGVVHCKRRR